MSPELIPVAITAILFGAAFVLAEMSRWIWAIYATVDLLWIVYGSLVGAPGPVTYGISMSVLCVYGLWRWDRKALDRERERVYTESVDEGADLLRENVAVLERIQKEHEEFKERVRLRGPKAYLSAPYDVEDVDLLLSFATRLGRILKEDTDLPAPLKRVITAALRWRDATPAEHAHKYNNPSVELIEALDRYEGGTR